MLLTETMKQHRKDLLKLMNLMVITDFGYDREGLRYEWEDLLQGEEKVYDQVVEDDEAFCYAMRLFFCMNAHSIYEYDEA